MAFVKSGLSEKLFLKIVFRHVLDVSHAAPHYFNVIVMIILQGKMIIYCLFIHAFGNNLLKVYQMP